MAMTMNSSSSFIGLLGLMIFVFSLVGMTMFGGTIPEECEGEGEEEVCFKSRVNYDSMFTSAILSFQIMTMENWNEILYITVLNNGISALIFVCTNLLVGGFLMMNIFLAILIDNYTVAVAEEKAAEVKKKDGEVERQRVLIILQGGVESEVSEGGGASGVSDESSVSSYSEGEEGEEEEEGETDEDKMAEIWYNDPSTHPAYKYSPLCLCKPGSTLHPVSERSEKKPKKRAIHWIDRNSNVPDESLKWP